MKLRKLFATAAMALCVALGASAQVSKEDVRIYINPGHGSWGPNNRHMATIGHSPISSEAPDTTDFFESNTNLRKALELLERLHQYGVPFDKTKNQENSNPNRIGAALDLSQNLVMSHVKCGPFPYETVNGVSPDSGNDFNRTLSTIAAEVESNDFDLFISIHSNANVDGDNINYLYFIYRTNRGAPEDVCVGVSQKCWDHRILDRHTKWSHYDNLVGGGSVKIAAGNYAVLSHSVPGYLVEGYFHTYQPARHRYMNFDMCRLEGIDYARGVADYYGWAKENTGDICGVVRDKHQKFSDALYTPKGGTNDIYKPLNGVVVTLKKDGNAVATDTTDVNYNGLFAFRNLEPGDYTVEFSHPDYKENMVCATEKATDKATESLAVTVKAAVTSYPTAFLESVNYVAPKVVYVNYPDSTAGKSGYILKSKYNMYDDGTFTGLATQLEGKTVRRQIVRDNKLYVLALDVASEPYIYLADLATGTVTELDKAAVATSANCRLKISDIALTADHALVASGMTVTYSDDSRVQGSDVFNGVLNVYKWTKNAETGLPETCEKWFDTSYFCNWYRCLLGQTITYSGTLAEGNIILTGQSATAQTLRIAKFGISDGAKISEMRFNGANDKTNFSVDSYTDNNMYELVVSPLNGENYVFDGNKTAPMEFTGAGDNSTPQVLGRNALVNVKSNGANYFKYAGKSLMVAPMINEEGKVAGIEMFDVTDGFDAATKVELKGATIDPVDYTYISAHGELKLTLNEVTGATVNAEINLYLVVDGKVAKFTQTAPPATNVTPATSGTANPFAYALSSEVVEGTLKVNYTLNADATAVAINVINAEGEVVATATGETAKGAHTADIAVADLAAGEYTWEVVVDGAQKAKMETFYSARFYHPRAVDVDNNFESPAFGHLYITEGMSTTSTTYYPASRGGVGLFIFDPQMNGVKNEKTGKYAFMSDLTYTFISYGADLARVRVAEDGRIFVTRCNNAGDYILYAPSHEDLVKNNQFHSLLAGGSLDAETYLYNTADGFLAGPNVGLDVKGSGDDLKLATVIADKKVFSFNASGSRVDEYALGTAEVLPTPTMIPSLSGYTIAPQVTNVEYDSHGGMWYCQYRGTPSNTEPALIYIDANGEQRYFEGVGGMARGGGGIRLSPDETQIAISTSKTTFSIYDLEYLEDGGVELVERTRITHGIGTNCYDMAWDLAGNIYICGNSGEYLKGFALPRTEAATTKAASKYAFTIDDPTAIDEVEFDENAPVEYYNLQGVKVENPEKGVFIKKQGKKAIKVVL